MGRRRPRAQETDAKPLGQNEVAQKPGVARSTAQGRARCLHSSARVTVVGVFVQRAPVGAASAWRSWQPTANLLSSQSLKMHRPLQMVARANSQRRDRRTVVQDSELCSPIDRIGVADALRRAAFVTNVEPSWDPKLVPETFLTKRSHIRWFDDVPLQSE